MKSNPRLAPPRIQEDHNLGVYVLTRPKLDRSGAGRLVCASCGAVAKEPADVCPTCWADRLEHQPPDPGSYPGAAKAVALLGGAMGLWLLSAMGLWAIAR